MCRAVGEVAVVSSVGHGKQEVVGHGVISADAPVLNVSRVDVGLRERARHTASGDQKLSVTRRLHHDVRQIVRRSAYTANMQTGALSNGVVAAGPSKKGKGGSLSRGPYR